MLYTYRCAACGHKGEERLRGDSHEGAESACTTCGASVALEWDGGVTLEVPKSHPGAATTRTGG